MARPTACRAWSSTATATRCRRSSSRPAPSAGRRRIADALLQATGAARLYERSDTSARAARRPARGDRLAARRLRATRRPRSRSASTAGASPRRRDRPQDRLLSRPARQPQALRRHGAAVRLRPRPQLLLLHRRLQRRRARRRRRARDGVDSSAPALARAAANVALNGFDAARHEALDADVNQTPARPARRGAELRRDRPRSAQARADGGACRARGARLQGHQPARAACCCARAACCSRSRARAASRPTCSTRSSPAPGIDAGVDGLVYARLGAAPDHPMTVTFPEGEYLKGLVILKR